MQTFEVVNSLSAILANSASRIGRLFFREATANRVRQMDHSVFHRQTIASGCWIGTQEQRTCRAAKRPLCPDSRPHRISVRCTIWASHCQAANRKKKRANIDVTYWMGAVESASALSDLEMVIRHSVTARDAADLLETRGPTLN